MTATIRVVLHTFLKYSQKVNKSPDSHFGPYNYRMARETRVLHIYQICNMNLIMDFKIKFTERVNIRYVITLYTAGIPRNCTTHKSVPYQILPLMQNGWPSLT